MKEEMRKINKGNLQKWFQRDNLIILVLAGILLFVIALPVKDTNSQEENGKENAVPGSLFQISGIAEEGNQKNSRTAARSGQTGNAEAMETGIFDYAEYLEKRLKEVLGGISGVGKVEVMITLESSEELVVEKDEPITRSNTNEEDSEGGTRVITELVTNETTIYRTEGSNSEPYVVKTILPKVEGVVVVAQGAGSGTVSKSITEVVQALFDVEAHKVKVVKGE